MKGVYTGLKQFRGRPFICLLVGSPVLLPGELHISSGAIVHPAEFM